MVVLLLYIAFSPFVEVIMIRRVLYNVILRDLSLMYKFCQLCGNEAYKNARPGNANVGGVNCDMLNGCYAIR